MPVNLDAIPDNASGSHTDEDGAQFSPESLTEYLHLRYGRFWKSKVRILLVQGESADIEHAAPGLSGGSTQLAQCQ
ncbi:hypothetical protein [Yersinia kristensenii]|uniref:hypothetical protein n=1 Tax=Yersinia kristensenii TaxID=28152 RepID=UPI0011A285F6|nr:hypothetical protein [Yersinia kristensenii]